MGINNEVFRKKSLYHDRCGSDRNITVVDICEMVGSSLGCDGGIKIALDSYIDDAGGVGKEKCTRRVKRLQQTNDNFEYFKRIVFIDSFCSLV